MKIEPALTAEEWDFERGKRFFEILQNKPEWCHKEAAMYLYDQPFGFTRDDVEELRWLSESHEFSARSELWINNLADRIEALLPPDA